MIKQYRSRISGRVFGGKTAAGVNTVRKASRLPKVFVIGGGSAGLFCAPRLIGRVIAPQFWSAAAEKIYGKYKNH